MLAKMFFDSPAAMGSVMLASQLWSNSARNWQNGHTESSQAFNIWDYRWLMSSWYPEIPGWRCYARKVLIV